MENLYPKSRLCNIHLPYCLILSGMFKVTQKKSAKKTFAHCPNIYNYEVTMMRLTVHDVNKPTPRCPRRVSSNLKPQSGGCWQRETVPHTPWAELSRWALAQRHS